MRFQHLATTPWPARFRLLAIAAILALMLGAAACGGDDNGSAVAAPTAVATTAESGTQPTSAVPQSSPTSEASAGLFTEAGVVKEWDTTADPSGDFATTFQASDTEIDVVFKVSEGGGVTSAWIYDGQWVILPGGLSTQAIAGEWTAFTFTPPDSAGFDAGDYEVILAKPGSSETRSLSFTIEAVSSDAALEQAGLSREWDASVTPDLDSFTTSFLPQDSRVYAVFQLAEGDSGQVASTWKYGGDELVFAEQPKLQLEGGRWGTLFLSAPEMPPGEYESLLSVTGGDETLSLPFTVGPDGAAPSAPEFDEAGLVNSLEASQAPDPADFATTFTTSDTTIYALFRLSAEAESVVWVTAGWLYEGLPILAATATGVLGTGTWEQASLTVDAGLPPGDYQAVLTIPGSNASESLSFTVN